MQDLDGEMTVMDSRGLDVQSYRITADRSRWNQYHDSFRKSLQAYLDEVVPAGRTRGRPSGLLELQVEAGIKRSIRTSRRFVLLANGFLRSLSL